MHEDLIAALRAHHQPDENGVLQLVSIRECREAADALEAMNKGTEGRKGMSADAMPGRKAAYVRSQRQTRNHHCHWPGCNRQVPPAMWGCKAHWFALPAGLRARVWAAYTPGQEINGTPSAAYIELAKAVQAWIDDRALRGEME